MELLMRKLLFLLSLCIGYTFMVSAHAGQSIYYTAKITNNDRYSSKGTRLKSVASILRQDRANVHKFGLADRGDQRDNYFYSSRNRNAFNRARIFVANRTLANQIVNSRKAVWVTVAYHPDRNIIEVHQPG
jgi:hypothetical protein